MDYSKYLSKRASEIKPSGIRKYFDVLSDMPNAISLGVGEPDFPTPKNVAQAGVKSITDGITQYTSNSGMPSLRKAIVKYVRERYGVEYAFEQVMVTVGASEGIDLAMRALLEPDDEVLIPEPCYVSYCPCVSLCCAKAVAVPCYVEDEFRLTVKSLEKVVTPKTKALVLPFPNNPTGAIMEKEHLEAIAQFAIEHDIIIISDEIYAELTYGGGKHCSIASLPGMQERTIFINGFSKAFAMTGWRLGYLCAPLPILKVMLKIHQFALMCAPTAAQYAGLEAIESGFADNFASITAMRDEYDKRRRLLVDSLNEMGLTCFEPKGAFYVFPCVKSTGMDGDSFVEKLLAAEQVAVVPGSAFGESGRDFVRISYAYSMERIKQALARIRHFLDTLNK